MTDLDQLDIMRRAITALGLGQCVPEELVAAARQSSAAREQARDRIANLESALQALGINPNDDPVYHAQRWVGGRDEDRRQRDVMERSLGDANARLQAAQDRIAELEGAPTANTAAPEARIADLERTIAAKSESLATANAALSRICEILCAPTPVCPEDAVTAVCSLISKCEIANDDAEKAEEALKEIARALDAAGAPATYSGGSGEPRPIPDAERIRLLDATLQRVSGDLFYQERIASSQREDIRAAEIALNDAGAPAFASGDGQPTTVLDLAARVRGLKA